MVSNRDFENVVAQINASFEELHKKIAKLEEKLDGYQKTSKGKSKG
jgi:hypothetical protein